MQKTITRFTDPDTPLNEGEELVIEVHVKAEPYARWAYLLEQGTHLLKLFGYRRKV
jgi:hypothetical protein